jgi:hypothetical protein
MDKSLKIFFAVLAIVIVFAGGYYAANFKDTALYMRLTEPMDDEDEIEEKEATEEEDDVEIDEGLTYFESGDVDYMTKTSVTLDSLDATKAAQARVVAKENYVDNLDSYVTVYNIGKVKTGEYAGDEIYMMHAQCTDMCVSTYSYKFVKHDGELIHLSRYETAKYTPEYIKPFLVDSDDEYIGSLAPPSSIDTPEISAPLYLSAERIILANGSEFEYSIGDFLMELPDFGEVYNSKGSDGCLYLLAPDGLYYRYELNPGFFDSGWTTFTTITDSTYINVTADYAYASTGCGVSGNCYRVDEMSPKDVTLIGTSSSGYDFFVPNNLYSGAASDKDANMIQQLVDTMHSTYTYQEDISFEDYVEQYPLILWQDELGRYGSLIKSDLQPPAECGKPVVYLYPEQSTDVSVKVDIDKFTVTVPDYKDGWNVKAEPNGSLYNYDDGKTYDYLFWEGISDKSVDIGNYGYVVKRKNLKTFIGVSLSKMGLNRTEIKDFKEFWIPEMLKNNEKYFEITFIGTEDFNKVAPLEIEPAPQSLLRVFMNYEPTNTKRVMTPQKFTKFERDGFTVVEWGGTSSRFHGIK